MTALLSPAAADLLAHPRRCAVCGEEFMPKSRYGRKRRVCYEPRCERIADRRRRGRIIVERSLGTRDRTLTASGYGAY